MALRWASSDHEHSYCRRGEEPAFETDRLRFEGGGIVITRRGQPVVELKPARPVPRPIAEADIEWLRARRVRGTMPKTDARKLVSEMRYDGEK
jgi:antitoxin (DNA-binding transcriptional repressor) of toxin-antitoxin stability system